MTNWTRTRSAVELAECIAEARELRAARASRPRGREDYPLLKQWQADRLARTYADLLASERYAPAAEFFLSDLYGPKDFRSRDDELARVVPVMVRVLPARALLTLLEAVKMDTLSESLDTDMVRACAPPGAATTSTGMPMSPPTAPAAAAPTANSRSRWWTRSARRWTA
jgi:hypothetical protein